ncbi:hypothetical protein WAE56_20090 [Iodobacter sp. LRB]|uniref:hypothetical protein n=1 Tax=unclassified Iodobacter TaxID=235634 RepID=UPI000C0DFA61|nr:hypothetical protein [Iodobacter sp. BJB302]PHV00947.1 hypothetical protein CSQ88_14775 [Iodobacter sp. BJB302]
MIKKWIVVVLFILPAIVLAGGDVIAERSILKKWGLSYCLSKNDQLNDQGSLAMGGYFQLGAYDNEAAYAKVRAYFDRHLKQETLVAQQTGQKLVLMSCLDAYERPEYDRLISKQDKYLTLH